ncbi:MAG: ATP synthase F1 subunit epsilon [Bacteroidetes bacterium]|nr:ATP synthase F1 subunit epsilon [Bacteroidota bacterium]
MNLLVVTPDQTLYDGSVKLVQCPGSDGSFELMDKHAALISTLKKGLLRIVETSGTEISIDILSGVVEISDNQVTILAEK